MHLWRCLLPQAFLTLNLMRQSKINPELLAYAQLHGTHDYNAYPVTPPCIQVLIHKKNNVRKIGHHMA